MSVLAFILLTIVIPISTFVSPLLLSFLSFLLSYYSFHFWHHFVNFGHSYSLFAVVYRFYIFHTTVSVMPKMMVCSLYFLFFIHIIVSTLTCSSTIFVCEALHSPSRYHLASLFLDWPPSDLSFSPRVFTFFTLFYLQLWSTFISMFPSLPFFFSFTPV